MFVFVYGTLQRGGTLHEHLAEQRFTGTALTLPDYRLYRIGWYPGLVNAAASQEGLAIHGEVWDVDDEALRVLDEVEDVESGLYERRPIQLQSPFDQKAVIAYFFCGDVEGCPDNGDRW